MSIVCDNVLILERFYLFKKNPENHKPPLILKKFLRDIKDREMKNPMSRQAGKSNYNNQWKKGNNGIKRNWLMAKKFKQTESERLCSQFKGILNKLNKNNFDKLMKELFDLDIKSEEQLSELVNTIFKKATEESSFCSMYSELCLKLMPYCVEENGQKKRFINMLMNLIQKNFKICINFNNNEELKQSEFTSKAQMLGCITFIGELYNNGLIPGRIICGDKEICGCLDLLWKSVEEKKLFMIDCICQFLSTIRDKLSVKCKAKKKEIVNKLTKLKGSEKIELREKFIILDTLSK